jgi:hypothetical protein
MTIENYPRVKDVPQMMATTMMESQLKVFNVLRFVRVVILQPSAHNAKADSFLIQVNNAYQLVKLGLSQT